MPAPAIFWIPLLFCVILLGVVAWLLNRVYTLSLAKSQTKIPLAPEGWSKLDELLSMLLSLQEHGVSHSGAVSREEFGRAVLDCACRLMKCDRGSVMMWDEKDSCLKIVAARSETPDKLQRLFLKPGEGVAGKAFSTGQPIFIADPAQDPRYLSPTATDVEPFVSIPLMVKGKPIGVLNLHAGQKAEEFSDYNVKFLGILAGESAVMLHNMDLFDSLQTFYLEMVQTLALPVMTAQASGALI
jgi:signal transduction protein with GAF and PtsI domain